VSVQAKRDACIKEGLRELLSALPPVPAAAAASVAAVKAGAGSAEGGAAAAVPLHPLATRHPLLLQMLMGVGGLTTEDEEDEDAEGGSAAAAAAAAGAGDSTVVRFKLPILYDSVAGLLRTSFVDISTAGDERLALLEAACDLLAAVAAHDDWSPVFLYRPTVDAAEMVVPGSSVAAVAAADAKTDDEDGGGVIESKDDGAGGGGAGPSVEDTCAWLPPPPRIDASGNVLPLRGSIAAIMADFSHQAGLFLRAMDASGRKGKGGKDDKDDASGDSTQARMRSIAARVTATHDAIKASLKAWAARLPTDAKREELPVSGGWALRVCIRSSVRVGGRACMPVLGRASTSAPPPPALPVLATFHGCSAGGCGCCQGAQPRGWGRGCGERARP
jgi:hypothetical protein